MSAARVPGEVGEKAHGGAVSSRRRRPVRVQNANR
jgi:hypothetical protein